MMKLRFKDPATGKTFDKLELFDENLKLEMGTVNGDAALKGLKC